MSDDDIREDAESRMQKSVESLRDDLSKIRTGRAHPSLLEHVTVEYYGSNLPLNQVASITAEDARTLAVSPWDKSLVKAVEKAIMNSDLGLNPASAGTVIRVPLPALTEERRRDLVKVVKNEGEGARVAIRNIRRDANQHLKNQVKAKAITEDDERREQERIQQLTDRYINQVDQLLEHKENELMEV